MRPRCSPASGSTANNMAAYIRRAGYQTLYDFGDDRAHHTREFMTKLGGAGGVPDREDRGVARRPRLAHFGSLLPELPDRRHAPPLWRPRRPCRPLSG